MQEDKLFRQKIMLLLFLSHPGLITSGAKVLLIGHTRRWRLKNLRALLRLVFGGLLSLLCSALSFKAAFAPACESSGSALPLAPTVGPNTQKQPMLENSQRLSQIHCCAAHKLKQTCHERLIRQFIDAPFFGLEMIWITP